MATDRIYKPGEPNVVAATGQRENWFKRQWKKTVGWKTVAVVLGGGATVVAGSEVLVNNIVSGDSADGAENVQAQNVQTIETHPTIEVATIPGTNIPNPNLTPSPAPETAVPTAEKPTPIATATATSTPTEKPQPTATQTEKLATNTPEPTRAPAENWTVKVDPAVSGRSNFRTVEEDVTIIKKEFGRFAQVGKLDVTLIKGSDSRIELEIDPSKSAKMFIGRDVYELEPKVLDEFGSYFDVEINAQFAKLLTAPDLERAKKLRGDIVSKYREFPSIERMFAKKSSDSAAAVISKYPNALFMSQDNGDFSPLAQDIFEQQLKSPLLAKFAADVGNQGSGYLDWTAFRRGESKRLDELALANPYYKLAFEILDANAVSLANWMQYNSEQGLSFSPKELASWYISPDPKRDAAIVDYTNMALTTALSENNQRLTTLMSSADLTKARQDYKVLYQTVSNEVFGRAFSRFYMGVVDDPIIAQYRDILKSAKAN